MHLGRTDSFVDDAPDDPTVSTPTPAVAPANSPTTPKPLSYTVYLSRHGESQANVNGIIGGDSFLSKRGEAYATRLCNFITCTAPAGTPVWTSALQRTLQTIQPLQLNSRYGRSGNEATTTPISPPTPAAAYTHTVRPGLNEIDAGVIDGMSQSDALARHPDVMAARKADKLRFQYPDGESYIDLMDRVGQVRRAACCVLRAASVNSPC